MIPSSENLSGMVLGICPRLGSIILFPPLHFSPIPYQSSPTPPNRFFCAVLYASAALADSSWEPESGGLFDRALLYINETLGRLFVDEIWVCLIIKMTRYFQEQS